MAFIKKTWLARLGTGLNKFTVNNSASKISLDSAPDTITQEGTPLSAQNMNDLEDRIETAFTGVDTELEELNDKVTAVEGGIIPKGDILSSNLPAPSVENKGWQYYCTDLAKYAVSDGTQWVYFSNTMLTDKPNANDTAHALTNAVATQINNQTNARLENLEQKAGDYVPVQYRGTDAVPTGKAKFALVEKIVGKTRAWNRYVDTNTTTVTLLSGHVFFTVISNTYAIINGTGQSISVTGGVDIVRDLTLIFGAGNEPSTVAEALQKLPDLGKYDAYNEGSLVSTEVSGVKSVGVNIWNEEWEVGAWNLTTGDKANSSTNIRCKNKIAVSPLTTYFFMASKIYYALFYDANDNYIGKLGANGWQNGNTTFETPANCAYVAFYMYDAYGTTYNHDIQICLNSYTDKTTYHPYEKHTLSLPQSVVLKSAGSVSEELDVATGEHTHPVKQIFLKDLNYQESVSGTNGYEVFSELTDAKASTMNLVSDRLVPASAWEDVARYSVRVSYMTRICITVPKSVASTVAGVKQWLTDNNVSLCYELATPDPNTNIGATPYNMIEVQGGGTINTVQEQSPVIDNCLDVGYLAL